MDLLSAIRAAREVRDVAHELARPCHDWESDEGAFLRHFGVPIEDYAEIVSHLSPEQSQLLDATVAVNPEAAVLWVLAMEEVG
jgi:hypothetical protein